MTILLSSWCHFTASSLHFNFMIKKRAYLFVLVLSPHILWLATPYPCGKPCVMLNSLLGILNLHVSLPGSSRKTHKIESILPFIGLLCWFDLVQVDIKLVSIISYVVSPMCEAKQILLCLFLRNWVQSGLKRADLLLLQLRLSKEFLCNCCYCNASRGHLLVVLDLNCMKWKHRKHPGAFNGRI